jgi:hypothetical protein
VALEHDFFFALDLSDQNSFGTMLGELADAVFGYVGFAEADKAAAARALHRALSDGAAAGHQRCALEFRANGGAFDIAVSFDGGPAAWRTSRPLP